MQRGGFLGPMISDIRDYHIDNFHFPTLKNMIFPFPSLFLCPKSVEITLYIRFLSFRKEYFRFVYNFCVRIR